MTTTATSPDHLSPRHESRGRWQLVVFIALAYGLSWWPALLRLMNAESAPVLPVGPSIAALIVVGWVYGRPGLRALLRSTVNGRIGRWWWGAAIPLAVAVSAAVLTIAAGAPVPQSADLAMAATAALITMPIVLVINGPLGEELGWRGYLLPHFLRRHSPITATVLLIPIWLGFHLPLMITNPGRYGLWWALSLVGMAFTMTWLHVRSGGSVLLAIVFHTVTNIATPAAIQLFAGADRPLVWQLSALLWVLTGVAVAAGPLRHTAGGRQSHTHQGVEQ